MFDGISFDRSLAVGAMAISIPLIITGGVYAACCYHDSLESGWRRLRVWALGGVTTLERKLSYNCAICQDSMEAHEEVRTLSCNHVFHRRGTDKCKDDIDKWLRTQPTMFCPVCRRTPRLVLPWKAPPPASPAPAPAPAAVLADQDQPESSSSGLNNTASPDLEDPPLPRPESPPALEEPLLRSGTARQT